MSFLDEIPRPELPHSFESAEEAVNAIRTAANERIKTSSAIENLAVNISKNVNELYLDDTTEKQAYRKSVIHGTLHTLGDLAATRRSIFGGLSEQPKTFESQPEEAWLATLLTKTDLYPPTDIFYEQATGNAKDISTLETFAFLEMESDPISKLEMLANTGAFPPAELVEVCTDELTGKLQALCANEAVKTINMLMENKAQIAALGDEAVAEVDALWQAIEDLAASSVYYNKSGKQFETLKTTVLKRIEETKNDPHPDLTRQYAM